MSGVASHKKMSRRGFSAFEEYIVIGIEGHGNPGDGMDQQGGSPDSAQCNSDFLRIDSEPGTTHYLFVFGKNGLRDVAL